MRYWSIVAVLLFPAIVSADHVFAVRPLDSDAAATIQQAQQCSAVIRGLIQELAQSNLIVHVQTDWTLPLAFAGTTTFVTNRGGYRYVRVRIGARLPARARVIALGHELQHAIEIARSDAADHSGVRRLLDATGYTLGGRYYETDSARKIEQQIRMER